MCDYGFSSVKSYDKFIIKRWRKTVSFEDDVWILGDVFRLRDKDAEAPEWYLDQLTGHKHLIAGNHDGIILANKNLQEYFASIDTMKTILIQETPYVLCHYPLLDWANMHKGWKLIFGHTHVHVNEGYEPICMRKPKAYALWKSQLHQIVMKASSFQH